MTHINAQAAVRRLIQLLEKVEESDAGNVFHPNRISSCRVADSVEMQQLLDDLNRWATNTESPV